AVDYKTGGADGESPEALHAKHLLQARCYAYALLRQGCAEAELRFVRVEREDASGAMQTVSYRFSAADVDELAACILDARGA
ncbi:MAG: PD-(D/E)XK nuclease family protein, partial [Lachnospiraceae bacterium]|nr:PD-(D/E)XK nuclease family protein [Lachnospiraceae bacterium]